MAERDEVARILEQGRRRLALRVGLRRAGWFLLAAILVLEVGLALSATPLVVISAILALAAFGCLVNPPRPSLTLTAAVLDAQLAQGATLTTAAEALGGAHPRFAPSLLHDARAALEGVSLRAALPVRLPVGLVLGAAAAVMLPLLLPNGARANSDLGAAPEVPSLLAPNALGGPATGDSGEAKPPGLAPKLEIVPLAGGEPPARDPFAALPLDVAEALRKRLAELSRDLPRGTGSTGAAPQEDSSQEPDALSQALRAGDAQRARRELERLAKTAGKGDRTAATRIRRLADAVGAPGGGTAPARPDPKSVKTGTDPEVGPRRGGRAAALPWALRVSVERYFRNRN